MFSYLSTLAVSLYAITGGPSVGKTSIINELETMGEVICREAATDIISQYQLNGVAHPWELQGFESEIYFEKVARELSALSKAQDQGKQKVFTDRGLLDTLVYLETNNKLDTDEYVQVSNHINSLNLKDHYRAVFFVEPYAGSEFIADDTGVRHEDTTEAIRLGIEAKRIYAKAGIPVIIVPPHMTPKERADFVIEKLHALE